MNTLPLGAPVMTKHNRRSGYISGYQLSCEKYIVEFEDGTSGLFAELTLKRSEQPLSGAELLDEVEFLLEQGQSPLLIPELVHRHPHVVARLAHKHGRQTIVAAFNESGDAEYQRKKMRR